MSAVPRSNSKLVGTLVELFPTYICCTSMSLPYQIGNGWFGGFVPTIAFAMVAATGDITFRALYPVLVASLCATIGLIWLPETLRRTLN